MLQFPRFAGLVVLGLAWGTLVCVGFFLLNRYAATSGEETFPPIDWPSDSQLAFQQESFNLVVAIHPHCPCSRASLEELSRLLAVCGDKLKVQVLMWEPLGAEPDWRSTGRWEQAKRLPGAFLYADVRGSEAAIFGAKTSGQMLLYGKNGRLLFSGGITSARGHEGDNCNREALRQRICSETQEFISTDVFGCPLNDPN